MKIAYVTTYKSTDLHAWSGLGHFILTALRKTGIEAESIDGLKYGGDIYLSKIKDLFYRRLQNKIYLRDRDPSVLKYFSTQVERKLRLMNPDIIFSPGTIPIAYLKTEKPIVFWTDATFAGLVNYYREFSNLCENTIEHGNIMEQMALDKCSLAIYSSEWAANSALTSYDVNPEKIKVVPFGANTICDKRLYGIENIIARKKLDTCNLLFIGVDWFRKGGDIALEVATLLNKQGLKTVLHVVGCTPPVSHVPSFMICHGFISKRSIDGSARLNQLLSESHFLILPSRAECYGIVFAEASSFGLPSLATKTGGVSTAIRDGINGWKFNLDASPEEYCNYITKFMGSMSSYNSLARSSFGEYSSRLNWNTAGQRVFELMNEHCRV